MSAQILEIVETRPFTDVLVAGYVYREGVTRFHADTYSVYLRFDGPMLRCRACEHRYALTLTVVDEISDDIPRDPQDEFCITSLYTLLLSDSHNRRRVDGLDAAAAE